MGGVGWISFPSPLSGKIQGLASVVAGNEIHRAGPIVGFDLKLLRTNKMREKKRLGPGY